MKITFITNYLTHHQLPFAEEMYRRLGKEFCFIATNRMEEERIRMGWDLDDKQYTWREGRLVGLKWRQLGVCDKLDVSGLTALESLECDNTVTVIGKENTRVE